MKTVVFSFLTLILCVSFVEAQHNPDRSLVTFNVGFTKASPEESGHSLSGNTFSLGYEKSNREGNLAGGVSVSYLTTSADSVNASGQTLDLINSVSFETVPILLYGKFMFGSPTIRGYIGGGFGIHFSTVTTYSQNVGVTGFDSGWMIGGLAGVNLYLSESLLLNAAYNLDYVGNAYYKDGMVNNFIVGLGFQI